MPRDTSREGVFCSSADQVAQTPDGMKAYLHRRFGKMRDMAPVAHTVDSLAAEAKWGHLNYVNPPFNNIGKWLDKAVEQYRLHGRRTVFLIPFRPHRLYFQRHIDHYSFVEYLAKGVVFKGYKNVIPHPMCLLGIGVHPSPASAGIIPANKFYVHLGKKKHTILGMAEKTKADFAMNDNIKVCLSVKGMPEKNYTMALIYTNMKRMTDALSKYTVVVPRQLYRDGLTGRLFNGSIMIIDAEGQAPPSTSAYRKIQLFVNKEYTN